MSTYSEEQRQQTKGPLWIVAVMGGVIWVIVAVWILMQTLDSAAIGAAEGIIPEPTSAQVLIAYASALVFALPGVGLIVFGLARRRLAGGNIDDQADKQRSERPF